MVGYILMRILEFYLFIIAVFVGIVALAFIILMMLVFGISAAIWDYDDWDMWKG